MVSRMGEFLTSQEEMGLSDEEVYKNTLKAYIILKSQF